MGIKGECAMQVVVQLVRVLVNLRQVGDPVLVVEELEPVRPSAGDEIRQPFRHLALAWTAGQDDCSKLCNTNQHLQLGIQQPQPDRDGDPGVHHVQQDDQRVGLGVEESPDGVGEGLAEGELPGGRAAVAVEARSLVSQEEADDKCRTCGTGGGIRSLVSALHRYGPD
jgi:hypothetical protein